MKTFTISWIAWAFDNAAVLVGGGYLGYRFGDTVKAWAKALIHKFDR